MHRALVAALERARDLGFLGPGPVEDHIEHAGAFALAATAPPARLLDLGSGGGVPGLVLAATWPGATVVLLDAQARRTSFLTELVGELGWVDRVEVVTGRAEELGRAAAHRAGYDTVVARSFGAPGVVAECGAPFLEVGGQLLVSEPPGEVERWPADGLAMLGVVDEGGDRVRRLRCVALADGRYPRRVGIPTKRPLF